MNPKESIIVLGGGIAGLTAAWNLREHDVLVLEGASRAGGWVQTVEKEGFLFELGPRSCRTYGKGAATLELIRELGMGDEVLPAASAAQTRYVLHQQKLTKIPAGIIQWMTSPFLTPSLHAIFRDLFSGAILADCSIAEFVRKRFGEDILDMFLNPLVSGVYAGDPEALSIASCFPSLFETQKMHGSLLKGMLLSGLKSKGSKPPFPLFTLKRGLNSLIDRLVERLGSARVKLAAKVTAVDQVGNGWKVRLESGEEFSCQRVVSTLPPGTVEKLWGFKAPSMASVAVVNMGYRQLDFPENGFGYLVPSKEKEKILGVVWDSQVFPEQQSQGQARLTVMIGGTTAPADWKTWDLEAIALDAVKRHMGISVAPDTVQLTIANEAIPQYEVGYSGRKEKFIQDMRVTHPGIEFRGALFDGVAINDCIYRKP